MPVLLLAVSATSAAQETWTPTSTSGAPSARRSQTAVWTGSKMIVWGGFGGGGPVDTGGIYDPGTDTWAATSIVGAPTRVSHTAVWTGSKMIVWGGWGGAAYLNTGAIFDPAINTWTPTSTVGAPTARGYHTALWTGSKMIVWGGFTGPATTAMNTGGIYDPATDTWTPTSTIGAPTEREGHTAVWTGSKMIVWGGFGVQSFANTGGIYDPGTDTWAATSIVGAPTPGYHKAVWTGSKMIVWGGWDGAAYLNTGAIFDPAINTWTPTTTVGAPTARDYFTALWTGSKMVVWGGWEAQDAASTGGIYDPVSDTWTATSTIGAPTARGSHTALWTGRKMVVWGGWNTAGDSTNTGGVYDNPAVIAPPPPPADFYTVTPCRLADTRNAAGPTGGPALVAGAIRSFPATGICGVPSTATAVSLSLTVTQPAAQGHLILYSGDAAGPPLVSTINFMPGVTRANNAIVLLATNGGTINVKNGSTGEVHLVLDVNGYFYCFPPPCPVPLAIELRVRSAAGGPVPGLTVDLTGSRSGPVQCTVEATENRCVVPGEYGTYELRVAAPGFQTVDLSVVVPGTAAPRCGCETVQTQEVEVVLTPS